MGTISKRKRRSFLPASSQLRYAAAYILITAAALFLLNLYASTTIRSVTFHAQADSLESKAQLLSNALLQLDELSAGRAAQAVNSMEELHTTRTVVTDAAGVAVYDSLTTGNAEGKTLLFPELVTALEGSDVFFSRYADGAVESGGEAYHFATKEEAIRELAGQLAPNTAMLVKASHAMHFEWIVEELCKAYD